MSLLDDILSFLSENISKAGSAAGAENRRARDVASMFLEPSVMDRYIMEELTKATPAIAGGVFRDLGLERKGGMLNASEYLKKLQEQPKYERFRQLSQRIIEKALGKEFPVYRAAKHAEPIMSGEWPTAIGTTLDPNWARNFASGIAASSGKPSYLLKAKASPEAAVGLLPTRKASWAVEKEMVLDPKKLLEIEAGGKYLPASSAMPSQVVPAPEYIKQQLEQALQRYRQQPANQFVERIKKGLAEAEQPPAGKATLDEVVESLWGASKPEGGWPAKGWLEKLLGE